MTDTNNTAKTSRRWKRLELALLIGLLVRRPFMGLNHFMEEKLEETELL